MVELKDFGKKKIYKKKSKKNQKHMLRFLPIDKTRELYPLSLPKSIQAFTH